MPKIRLEAVLGATDSSHAVLVGTTDGGTVRVTSKPIENSVGMLLAMTASVVGPIEFDLPDEAVESIVEIDPSAE